MAIPTCIKCGGTVFELRDGNTPKGSGFKLSYVMCTSCGGVIGVLDHYNLGALIYKLAEKLGMDLNN